MGKPRFSQGYTGLLALRMSAGFAEIAVGPATLTCGDADSCDVCRMSSRILKIQ